MHAPQQSSTSMIPGELCWGKGGRGASSPNFEHVQTLCFYYLLLCFYCPFRNKSPFEKNEKQTYHRYPLIKMENVSMCPAVFWHCWAFLAILWHVQGFVWHFWHFLKHDKHALRIDENAWENDKHALKLTRMLGNDKHALKVDKNAWEMARMHGEMTNMH